MRLDWYDQMYTDYLCHRIFFLTIEDVLFFVLSLDGNDSFAYSQSFTMYA